MLNSQVQITFSFFFLSQSILPGQLYPPISLEKNELPPLPPSHLLNRELEGEEVPVHPNDFGGGMVRHRPVDVVASEFVDDAHGVDSALAQGRLHLHPHPPLVGQAQAGQVVHSYASNRN